MIVTGALLFLLGASVSAGPYLPSLPTEIVISKHKHGSPHRVKIVPSAHRSSVIENYIQEGTNVFFKPQFVLSAEQMPQQLQPMIAAIENDDCKTTYSMVTPVIIEDPLHVVEEKTNELPLIKVDHLTKIKPATLIEQVKPIFEQSIIVEEPLVKNPENVIVEIKETVKPVVIPPAPILPPIEPPKTLNPTPVYVEVEAPNEISFPFVIPPAPVLPPMELPKLPVLVEEAPTVAELPCEHLTPVAPIVEIEGPKGVDLSVVIPSAPVLPPMDIPKVPVLIEEAPIIIEVAYEQAAVAPVLVKVEEEKELEAPIMIPPGPVLPPIELPKLPVMIEHSSSVVELPREQPVPVIVEVEEPKKVEVPVVIPPAPVLPPMELPKLPVLVEVAPTVAELPCEHLTPVAPIVEIEGPKEVDLPVVIPSAPVLPPMDIPKVPVFIEEEPIITEVAYEQAAVAPVLVKVEEEKELEAPIMIPPGPVLPPIELPKLPVMIEHSSSFVELPHEQPVPVIVEVEEPKKFEVPVVIPPAPILPPMEMPAMPVLIEKEPLVSEHVIAEEPIYVEKPIESIPSAPVLPPLEISKVPIVVEEYHNTECNKIGAPCFFENSQLSVSEIQQPIYIEQNRFVLPGAMPSSKLSVEIPNIPQWVMSSIPNFSKSKHCVDEIVVERILPKFEKGIYTVPSEIPVHYVPLI